MTLSPQIRRAGFAWAAILPLLLAACDQAPKRNVVLVTFDTTRADHIGDYGVGNHTPQLDALAAQGVRFAQARTAVPITAPSHSTIMTGKYPIAHGFRDNGLFTLGPEQQTLAESLSGAGYATAAAIGAYPLIARFGLDQGFDLYDDHITVAWENFLGDRVAQRDGLFFESRDAGRVNDAVLPWLAEHAGGPFFLWVHYFDPHQPYDPPAPYDQLFVDDPYRAEIAFADESFGTLRRHLEDLGVWDDTIVVFTADHGEGLGEHEETTHSMLLYDSTVHVPLIVRVPGAEGNRVVEESVGTVDILPTVLDLVGVDIPAGVQGRSLAPALVRGATLEPRPLYAETLSPRLSHRWGELRALVFDGRKYVFGPRPELFDLAADPRELSNLVASEPEEASAMQRRLASFIRDNAAADLPPPAEPDEETKQRLFALGYLSGSGFDQPIEERLNGDGEAPQDRVVDVSRLSVAKDLMFKGQPAAAREVILGLLETSPQSPFYLEMLAGAEIALGHVEEGGRILAEISGTHPDHRLLALHALRASQVLLAQGRSDEAEQYATQSLEFNPTAEARYALARVFQQREDQADRYLEELQATLDLDPQFVVARVDLALELIRREQYALAESHLLQAMSDYPFYPRTFFNYGRLALDFGQQEEALRNFRRAVELDRGYLKARHALVAVLVESGQLEAARSEFQELERLAPTSPETADARRILEAGE
jgi:arylsulfatase A-like enzyme/Flp pilus assembly protein TadD